MYFQKWTRVVEGNVGDGGKPKWAVISKSMPGSSSGGAEATDAGAGLSPRRWWWVDASLRTRIRKRYRENTWTSGTYGILTVPANTVVR